MSQKEISNIFKSHTASEKKRVSKTLTISSEIKAEEFKNLKLSSNERKQSGSF